MGHRYGIVITSTNRTKLVVGLFVAINRLGAVRLALADVEKGRRGDIATVHVTLARTDDQVLAFWAVNHPKMDPRLVELGYARGGHYLTKIIKAGKPADGPGRYVMVAGLGWAVFDGDKIQRDDTADMPFSDDDAAITHVRALAALGDPGAKLAIERHDSALLDQEAAEAGEPR